jgi:opacity protein-like surface antigen
MKFAVLAALVAIALPAPALAADWVNTGETVEGREWFVDKDSIVVGPKGYKRAWVRVENNFIDSFGNTAAKRLEEHDCENNRYRTLYIKFFKGKKIDQGGRVSLPWRVVDSGSAAAGLQSFICSK